MALTRSSVTSLGLAEAEVSNLSASLDLAIGTLMPNPAIATAMAASREEGLQPVTQGNIVGVGVGTKVENGERKSPSIVVLVRKKVGKSAVPSDLIVPDAINGVPTSVRETGDIVAQFTSRRRPAPGGVSIGNCREHMAGTLGCYVRSVADDREQFVLSNNHVLALVNASPLGTDIPQPGLLDGGSCDTDVIASLTRFHAIDFAAGAVNLVDCAVARVADPAVIERRLLRSSAGRLDALRSPHVTPTLGAAVQKSGRTTGHTQGTITLVGATVYVNMGTPTVPRVARFDRQFEVTGRSAVFSRPGDSGSLVTTDDNNPVGLLFAGGGGVTFCNDIANVLTTLGVAILY